MSRAAPPVNGVPSPRPWALLAWGLAALPVLLWAAPHTSIYPRSLLPDMVDGTAYRPYVRRVLVPWTARAAETAAGPGGRAAAARLVERTPMLRDRFRWEPDRAVAFATVLVVHGVALVAFAWGFYALALSTWSIGPGVAAMAATAGVLLVPLHFGYQNFLYDLPLLALFTWGLALIRRARWRAFAWLWPIGLLNKETFVLLAIPFARRFRATKREFPWRWAAVLGGIAALVGAMLWIGYRDTPGGAVEFHLQRNLAYRPGFKQHRRDLVYVAFWIYALWGWRAKRTIVADALAIGGILFVTTFFLGFLGEWRDFYEVFPLGLLLALHTTLRVLRREPALVAGAEAEPRPAPRAAAAPS